jgi:hypothetical protein
MKMIGTCSLVLACLAPAARGEPFMAPGDNKVSSQVRVAHTHAVAQAKPSPKDDAPKQRKPRFTISKETTYVLGPVDKDGYIDYATALNERLSQGVTPANNANVLIWKAIGPRPEGALMPAEFYKWLSIDKPPENGDYFIGLEKYLKEHLKIDDPEQAEAIRDQQTRSTQRPWTAQQYPHIAGWLKMNEKPMAVLIEATRRSHYFSPLVPGKPDKGPTSLFSALIPAVQKTRELAVLLAARAMLRVGAGRHNEAWQDLLACHRLGRHVARGATLIEGLVGIALDHVASAADVALLAHSDLSAQQIKERLRDLQQLPPMPLMADKLELGERFVFLDSIKLFEQGGIDAIEGIAAGHRSKAPGPIAQRYLESIHWDEALRSANRWYDRLAAAMRIKDHEERHKQLYQLEVEIKTLKAKTVEAAALIRMTLGTPQAKGKAIGDILICLLVPAFVRVQQAWERTEQEQQNLHLAFALAAYRRDHGRYPQKLDTLAPTYLPRIPLDPGASHSFRVAPRTSGRKPTSPTRT